MLTLFLHASLIILVLVTLLWLWSILIKNVSIIDIFWGIGFVIVNAFYFYHSETYSIRQTLICILVSLWGIRLSTYLALRNIGKGEDYRYQQFRQKYGPERYWWFSFFQVFLLQGVLIMIISLPLLAINSNNPNLNLLDAIALIVWCIGFVFEAGGDYQLAKFKKNPANKGKVLNKGFWKYTRHPNYFGDAAVWTGYGLFCIASGIFWPLISVVIMILLLLKVSGVALLEENLKTSKPQYKEYMEKTSAFLPRLPKK